MNDPDSPQARASDLRAGIERRLTSLESQAIPQLAACAASLQLHAELVDEMRQDALTIDAQLEELALLAEEASSESLRASILQAADFLSARLSRARVQARQEALTSKRRIDSSAASSQREALLGPARNISRSPIPPSGSSKDDELMNATANVTDGLRQTRQLLEQELERSSMSTQMLERSSQTLTLTSDQYTSFSGLINASKGLITTMQKADTLDRILILAALLLFGLVCLLIVKRRIIDRGIRAATLFSRIAGVGSSPSVRSVLSSSRTSVSSKAQATITSTTALQKSTPSSLQFIPSTIVASASLASASIAATLSTPSQASSLSSDSALATALVLEGGDTIIPTTTSFSISTDFASDPRQSLVQHTSLASIEASPKTIVPELEADGASEEEGAGEEEKEVRVEHILDEL